MQISKLYPFVLPEVVGCPQPTMDQAILLSAIDFCRDSLVWAEFLDPIPLLDGVSHYELDAPSGAFLHTVESVDVGSAQVIPKSMPELKIALPNWRMATGNVPSFYNMDEMVLRVFPTPVNADQPMLVKAIFTPSITSTTLPDFLVNRYVDVISAGAKSRLMSIPMVAWSNPQMALYYKTTFENGVTNARILKAHGNVPSTVKVKYRPFGF